MHLAVMAKPKMVSSKMTKLSELIRKGAAMIDNRQCTEDYIRYDDKGRVCLCVLGAAYYGMTGNLPLDKDTDELSVWDTVKDAVDCNDGD